ncbi:MAG: TolC family protein [Bacteroidota bacterium]
MMKYFYLITLLLILAEPLFAQEELSAKEAVVTALENNYQMQIADERIAIAEKNNKWSEAGLFPTVELTASVNNAIADNTNNPFTFTPGLIYNRSISPGITANWNIFTGMGVKITKERLSQLEKQSNGNANVVLENTAFDVLNAYYNVLMQESQLNTLKELKKATSEQVQYEAEKYELGQSNQLALAQLQNQLYSDSISIIQQEVVLENAYRNLLLLMNVPIEELTETPFPSLSDSLNIMVEPISEEEVIQSVAENNQNLKNQMINQELQSMNTDMQRSFLYPTVNLQLAASPSFGNFRSLSDDNLNAETQQINYTANLSLRYSLFDNWKNKRAVEVAKIEEKISALNTSELKKELTTNAVNLIRQYEVRNQLVNVANTNAGYAKRAYDLGLERFKLGQINSIELSQLRNSLLNAEMEVINLQFQRIQTYMEIYRIGGNLLLDYK